MFPYTVRPSPSPCSAIPEHWSSLSHFFTPVTWTYSVLKFCLQNTETMYVWTHSLTLHTFSFLVNSNYWPLPTLFPYRDSIWSQPEFLKRWPKKTKPELERLVGKSRQPSKSASPKPGTQGSKSSHWSYEVALLEVGSGSLAPDSGGPGCGTIPPGRRRAGVVVEQGLVCIPAPSLNSYIGDFDKWLVPLFQFLLCKMGIMFMSNLQGYFQD